MQSKEILAYMAGIVDGEGCIHIKRRKFKTGKKNIEYSLRIDIRNTSRILIDWLLANFGGCTSFNRARKPEHKHTWSWQLCCGKAQELLKKILPHLVIKKQQALLGIAFRDVVDNRLKGCGTPLTIGELAEREYFSIELRRLNARGPSGVSQPTPKVIKNSNPQILMFKKENVK